VQQVLLENELCLVGFSGSDPNFLQWIGWVRDQLGASARPIRLIGVLELTPSQRAYFSKNNITPIDLAPLVQHLNGTDQHSEATRLLFEELAAGSPTPRGTWVKKGKSANGQEVKPVEQVLSEFKADRLSHPGWLITPSVERYFLRIETERTFSSFVGKFDELSEATKCSLCFELCWRFETSFWRLSEWLVSLSVDVLNMKKNVLDRCNKFVIAMALAKHYRNAGDYENFRKFISLAQDSAIAKDEIAEVEYENCLWSRDRFEYKNIEAALHKITGDDPIWKLRRAYLSTVIHKEGEGASLVRECFQEISDRRIRDRNSVWLTSREAWVRLVLSASRFDLDRTSSESDLDDQVFDNWPIRFTELKCDPWDELRSFDDEIDKEFEHQRKQIKQEVPKFDPGVYRSLGRGRTWRSESRPNPWYELTSVSDRVGLPKPRYTNIIDSKFNRIGRLINPDSLQEWLFVARAVQRGDDGGVDVCFNRVRIALMEQDVVEELFKVLVEAINYGRTRFLDSKTSENGEKLITGWVEKVSHLLEIASRLVIRLDAENAKLAFKWACEIGKHRDFNHWWLYEPLGNLMQRSLDAIPSALQKELVADFLNFPCGAASGFGMNDTWPHFSERLRSLSCLVRPSGDWDAGIQMSLEAAKSSDRYIRTEGILKLLPLIKETLLSPVEVGTFSTALWAQIDDETGLPANTNLYPHVFLEGPPPPHGSTAEIFTALADKQTIVEGFDDRFLESIAGAANLGALNSVFFSPESASAMLKKIASFAPTPPTIEEMEFQNTQMHRAIGRCLTQAVLPALQGTHIGTELISAMFELSQASKMPATMSALPLLVQLKPEMESEAIARIRTVLVAHDYEIIQGGTNAVACWSKLSIKNNTAFPADLASELAGACLARRPGSLLQALALARQLIRNNQFVETDHGKLIAALDLLFVETAYENTLANNHFSLVLTLIRRECVRLAAALALNSDSPVLTKWLACAKTDPLPEVRFALQPNEELE
jgi:hypothetical protein